MQFKRQSMLEFQLMKSLIPQQFNKLLKMHRLQLKKD
jgi:hypothetical protein